MRKTYKFAKAPQAPWQRSLKHLRTALIAGLSAIAGAVAQKTSGALDTYVAPVVARTTCAARELLTGNEALRTTTVLIVPMSGEAGAATASELSKALAQQFGLNVIQLCTDVSVASAGDREINLLEQRHRISNLLTTYDADLLIHGHSTKDVARIAVYGPAAPPNLITLISEVSLDAKKIDSEVSGLFATLVMAGAAMADDVGCTNPVIQICSGRQAGELSKAQLLEKFERLLKLHRELGGQRAWSYATDAQLLHVYVNFSVAITGIGMKLFREHGVDVVEFKNGYRESIFDSTSTVLNRSSYAVVQALAAERQTAESRWGDRRSKGLSEGDRRIQELLFGGPDPTPPGPPAITLARGEISLVKAASACRSFGDATSALRSFETARRSLAGSETFRVIANLRIARAEAILSTLLTTEEEMSAALMRMKIALDIVQNSDFDRVVQDQSRLGEWTPQAFIWVWDSDARAALSESLKKEFELLTRVATMDAARRRAILVQDDQKSCFALLQTSPASSESEARWSKFLWKR